MLCMFDQQVKAFNGQDKKKRWEWETLLDTFQDQKKISGSPINEDYEVAWLHTSHDPIHTNDRYTNLEKNQSKECLVHPIKSLYKV